MSYETILTEADDHLLTITLNRPDRLNAWTYQMGAELAEAVEAANADDDVEAIVVTGAGRGFCAGADIKDVFDAQAKGEGASRPRQRNWVELVRESKPMVAAVNGAAVGVGLTQILPMDMLVASTEAKLSLRFIRMGLVPELASSQLLTLRVGFGACSDLMLTGRTVGAEEALALRLVDRVVAPEALLTTARDLARAMGSNPQAALRKVKRLLTLNATETDLLEVQRRELEALNESYASPEHKEAISAFIEKRDPDFRTARRSG